jgi:serine/threonine-protein phosphatase 4 regulatory subunit 1
MMDNLNSINSNDNSNLGINEITDEGIIGLSEVDLGNKDQTDYDELISFNHTFFNYRIAEMESPLTKDKEFALLIKNEFLSANITVDIKSLSDSEIKKMTKQRINNFNESESQKITIVENFSYYIEQIGLEDTVEIILPKILNIPNEKEIIVERFLENFQKILVELNKFGAEGQKLIKTQLIDVLENIYRANIKSTKILDLCNAALVELTKYIEENERGQYILTIVIQMAHEEEHDNYRINATKLFNNLAKILGRDLLEQYVVPQVASFADDHECKVRKSVAENLINICEGISPECFKKKMLPLYEKISKDSMWNVRKVAVEILPKITKLCDKEIISSKLLNIFKSFCQDQKNFVRYEAVEIFGEFLSLLDKDDIKNYTQLLDFYINTIEECTKNNKKDDLTIIKKCAYNFPAVLVMYGPENWDKLKPCFVKMAEQKEERIKLPLAASLGELSKILGNEVTENDLLDFVDKFYKENNSEMKMKILGILPDIIRNISSNKKNQYLENIKIMIGNKEDKWRKRLAYSKIIGKFHNTYSDTIIYKRVFPIAINFCFDDVHTIREKSAGHNSRILLQLLTGKEDYKKKTYTIVKSFAQSINFSYRQLFILMCKHLFESEELYKNYIAPLLLDLAYDKIINVRISLSKFIEKIIKKNKFNYLKNDETMRKIVTILRKDTNNEVNSYMKDLNDIKDIDVQLGVYVNDKFIDIMKYVSDEFGITKNVPLESIVRETSNSIKVNKDEVTNDENIISTKNNNNDINNGNVLVDNPVIPLQNNINNNNDNKHDVKNLEYQTPKSEENKHDDQVVNSTTPEKDDKNVDNQISNEEKNNEQNDNNQTSGSNEKEETKES